MGMIVSLKVGYKTKILLTLLNIFDEGGGRAVECAEDSQRQGYRGLEYGGKETLLNAMEILKEIWDADAKYVRSVVILRCWRKAKILPISWELEIGNAV